MLVAIEGIDGSGKGSLTRSLVGHIADNDSMSVCSVSFPMYRDTRYGHVVGRYLNGDFGDSSLHPVIHGTLFALDRLEYRERLKELLMQNQVVLCDRYVPSNICYSVMKADQTERDAIAKHFMWLEYDLFRLPMPELIIFLDIPAHQAVKNIASKNARDYTDKQADLLEKDTEYLQSVRDFYIHDLHKYHPGSFICRIDCMDESGTKMKTIEQLTQIAADKIQEAIYYRPLKDLGDCNNRPTRGGY